MKRHPSASSASLAFLALLGFLAAPALAAGPGGDDALPDADIVAAAVVSADPARLTALASDLQRLEALWPEDCTRKWVHGAKSSGVGASAELVYTMGPMKRRLAVTVSRVEEGRLVELDHAGKKGFITRLSLKPGEVGTAAELHTWIQPPPKPFRKMYFNKVQPEWQACQAGLLEALDGAAAGG